MTIEDVARADGVFAVEGDGVAGESEGSAERLAGQQVARKKIPASRGPVGQGNLIVMTPLT